MGHPPPTHTHYSLEGPDTPTTVLAQRGSHLASHSLYLSLSLHQGSLDCIRHSCLLQGCLGNMFFHSLTFIIQEAMLEWDQDRVGEAGLSLWCQAHNNDKVRKALCFPRAHSWQGEANIHEVIPGGVSITQGKSEKL